MSIKARKLPCYKCYGQERGGFATGASAGPFGPIGDQPARKRLLNRDLPVPAPGSPGPGVRPPGPVSNHPAGAGERCGFADTTCCSILRAASANLPSRTATARFPFPSPRRGAPPRYRPLEPGPYSGSPPPSRWTTTRKVGVGIAIAGTGALVTAAYFGVRARDDKDEAERRCPEVLCTDSEAVGLNESAQTSASRANQWALAGVGAIATGVVLWFVGAPESGAGVTPVVAGGHVGLRYTGRF